MATISFTKAPINDTDANFRLWAQAVNDAIVTTAGWTDTAATGQIDLTTVSKPGAANTYQGFKVYSMNDSLQGTYPCFLKVEFGSGPTSANNPGLRLGIGTVHNGSGTLTGTQVSLSRVANMGASSASLQQCYASGTTSRVCVAMFLDNAAGWSIFFGVERTKDSAGADNGDGIVLYYAGDSGTASVYSIATHVVPPSGGVPPLETRWMIPFSKCGSASTYNSKVGMGLLIPFMGPALRPLLGVGAMNASDYPTQGNTITVTCYGASHTYIALGSQAPLNAVLEASGIGGTGTTLENTVRIMMRYE